MGLVAGIRNTVPLIPESWPVDVLLRIERGNGYTTKWDKGRRIQSDVTGERYELKNRGKKTQAVPNSAIEKVGDQHILQMVETDNGELVPLNVDIDDEQLSIVQQDATSKAYRYNRYNQARQFWQTKSIWSKYHSEISILLFAVAFLIMSYGLIKFLGGVTGEMSNAANIMQQAAETMVKARQG